MPLHKKYSLEGVNIYIWHITEELGILKELAQLTEGEIDTLNSFKSETRKVEWCAVRSMLRSVIDPDGLITYKASGAPLLHSKTVAKTHISISHSHKFVAIAICGTTCGIDIELTTRNFERVSSRFVNEHESVIISQLPYTKNTSMAIIWSFKESVFKCSGYEDVDFKKDIKISDIKNGTINYSFRGCVKTGIYILEGDHVVTYT